MLLYYRIGKLQHLYSVFPKQKGQLSETISLLHQLSAKYLKHKLIQ